LDSSTKVTDVRLELDAARAIVYGIDGAGKPVRAEVALNAHQLGASRGGARVEVRFGDGKTSGPLVPAREGSAWPWIFGMASLATVSAVAGIVVVRRRRRRRASGSRSDGSVLA
jgi:hypothetical protein